MCSFCDDGQVTIDTVIGFVESALNHKVPGAQIQPVSFLLLDF